MKNDPSSHEERLKKAERIASLIAGHLKGTLSNEEADELDNWITESDENLELFENLTDEDNIEMAMQQYLHGERQKQAAFDELKRNIHEGSSETKFTRWPLFVAATVAVVVAATVLFLYNQKHRSSEKPVADSIEKSDIPAGSDKAVLTLSDGRTLILDSTLKGVLAKEGPISIQQHSSGEVSYSGSGAPTAFNTVSTPRAGQYQLLLGDGTKVWLNAESALKFPADMTAADRRVELKGEAYFEVARNPAKPFRVTMVVDGRETAVVEVLGTHFDVDAYNDEGRAKTTLLEGAIKIKKGAFSRLLRPGQQAIIADEISVESIDAGETVAWKEGRFLFRDATLQAIAEQLKRWYDIDVEIEGKSSQHFNMEISRHVPLSRLLSGLEKTGQVHFSLTGKKLVIKP